MYLVKEIDKPKVNFEYEDINMYNFKTKVLKSIKHEPLNMTFHDDIQNKVLDFFNTYRLAHSPISSLNYEQKSIFEDAGMDFYAPNSGGPSSASMGILANNNTNMLSFIEVIQIYAHGTKQNSFIFVNPRIEHFDFDNLDHGSSEGNALSVSFNYDSLYINSSDTHGTPAPAWGASDILGNKEIGSRNQFGNQLMGSDSTGLRSAVSGLSGFADALGSPISAIASAFGNITDKLKGVVSSATSEIESLAKSTFSSAIPAINQATAGLFQNKNALDPGLSPDLAGPDPTSALPDLATNDDQSLTA
jgi:hypothetical protein